MDAHSSTNGSTVTDQASAPAAQKWQPRPSPLELAVLAAAVAALAVLVLVTTRDNWVAGDFWGLVLDQRGNRARLFADHAGHLVLLHRLAARWVLATSQLGDLGVVHGLLRVAAWATLAGSVWWVVRARSRDAFVAFVAFAVVLFHGGSGFVQPWLVGNPLAYASGILAAWWIAQRTPDDRRDRVVLAALLLVAVVSTTAGVLAAVAVAVVVLVVPRLRPWWPSLLPAAAVQVAWRLVEATPPREVELSVESLAAVAVDSVRLVHAGTSRLVGLGDLVGWVCLAVLCGFLVWLLVTRRLDATDAVVVLWAGLFVSASLLVRAGSGQGGVTTVRYGVAVTVLLVVVVASHLRWPRTTPVRSATLLGAAALVAMNAVTLVSAPNGLRWYEERSSSSREVVEQAAELLDDGHPFVDGAHIDRPRAGMLTSTALARLVDDGYRPTSDDDELAAALGDLQVRADPRRPTADLVCRTVGEGGEIAVEADGTSWVQVSGSGAVVVTRDRGVEGRQALPLSRSDQWRLRVADVDQALVTPGGGGDARVCREAG